MKKIILLAMALCLVCTGAMAQKKNAKPAKTAPKTVTLQSSADVVTPKVEEAKTIDLPEVTGMDMPLIECLKQRRTIRDLRDEEIPQEMISSLLWSAYGINREEEGKRVVPSAVNMQEFDIYLFTREGVYRYEAEKNHLVLVLEGDHRQEISDQKHFAVAPVSILIVANYDRMGVFQKDKETREFDAAVDCGYVSQNIDLFCASHDLGTVACGGIDRDTLHKLLGITNGKALLAHPVGMHN